jgi:hypothetical protein
MHTRSDYNQIHNFEKEIFIILFSILIIIILTLLVIKYKDKLN